MSLEPSVFVGPARRLRLFGRNLSRVEIRTFFTTAKKGMTNVTLVLLLLLLVLAGSSAFFLRAPLFSPQGGRGMSASSLAASYLDSLQQTQSLAQPAINGAASVETTTTPQDKSSTGFVHVPLSFFGLDKLTSKGPRATFDWGTPQDWSRKLADDGVFRGGAWFCTEGGWPSPNGKAVTEIFYVLEGHGSLGDADGETHYFGPGDMVIIPKGHTGRWDVNQPIHKVWAVNAHPNVEESSTPIRVQVDHYHSFAPRQLAETSNGHDPLYGSTATAQSSSHTFYDVGPTKVGVWSCQPGSFPVSHGARSWFHVLEGIFFVTDAAEGTSRRCVGGDTVMLPTGWSGHIDVIAPVKKVWTTAS